MTPTEKGKELIEKFKISIDTPSSSEMSSVFIDSYDAKTLALICVDEVLTTIKSIIGEDKWMWHESQKDIYDDWLSVRSAIETM